MDFSSRKYIDVQSESITLMRKSDLLPRCVQAIWVTNHIRSSSHDRIIWTEEVLLVSSMCDFHKIHNLCEDVNYFNVSRFRVTRNLFQEVSSNQF